MSKASLLTTGAIAISLAGCAATVELNKVSARADADVSLRDSRPPEERLHRRDGIVSPVAYYGDEDFDSSPLRQFSLLLGAKLPAGKYDLEVTKFRVIDIFPQRVAASTSAALYGALGSMGYEVYFVESQIPTQDNISCVVDGRLGAKPVRASASVPYRISPFATLVKHDPSFKQAVNECLDQLARAAAKSL